MVDIHDRRPIVLNTESVREWLSKDTSPQRAEEILHTSALPEGDFNWNRVSRAVGNIRNQGSELISKTA